MRRLKLLVVMLAVLALAVPALAQTAQTGVIEGRVVDADGAPVDGAVVACAQADGSYPRDAVTDADGRFRIQFLVPGAYNLSIQAENLVARQVTGLRVSAATVTPLTVKMPKSLEVAEEVTVTAERQLVDRATTDRGVTLDKSVTEAVPLARRATAVLELVPGVSEGSAWGAATTQANNYLFDGVSVNQPGWGGDFLLPNPDWIEEVQVKGLGAGAEYGNFQGAAVNIVTKSGSNTFRGGVRANFESSSWNGDRSFAPTDYALVLDRRWEVNTDVSGPVVKDKLFYFVSLQQIERDEKASDVFTGALTNRVSYLPTKEERVEKKLFAKLTWQATNNDLFHLVVGKDNVTTDYRGIDAFTEKIATQRQKSPAKFYNLSWNRVFGRSSFLEVKLTGYSGQDDRLPYNGDTPGIVVIGGNGNAFQNTSYTRYRTPRNNALSAMWDVYLKTGAITHHLKIGGEAERGKWREQRVRNGNLTWRPDNTSLFLPADAADPANWGYISSDWGGEIDLNAETRNNSFFVQDYMQVTPKLSINAGLRWGQWIGRLTPGFGSGPQFTAMKDSGFDPRIGFVYDVAGNGKWLAKAHWGRYHQGMFALLFDRARGGNVFRDIEYWDWIGEGDPDPSHVYTLAEREQLFEYYDSDPLGTEVGPVVNYRQPYVDEWLASVEWAFHADWKLGLAYVNRTNKNLVSLVDRNLGANYEAFSNVRVLDRRTGTEITVLPTLYLEGEDFEQDLVLTTEPRAKRELEQVQLTLDRKGRGWTLGTSLVYSDLTGNFDSVSGYEDSAGGEGAGGFVRPNAAVNWNGRLPGNDKWQFKLFGNVDLPWKIRAAGFFSWYSGSYTTPYFVVDRNRYTDDDGVRRMVYQYLLPDGSELSRGALASADRQAIFTAVRGAAKYPALSQLDLRFERPFELGKSLNLVLAFDVFNVLDADADVSRIQRQNLPGTMYVPVDDDPDNDIVVTLPGYGYATTVQAPRAFRVSTALRW